VERTGVGLTLVQHDGQTMQDKSLPIAASRIWFRADCDYFTQLARFSYSADGETFHSVGEPFRMVTIGVTFQGVRYALFSFHRGVGEAGFADFDSIEIKEPNPHGITRPIPYGRTIELSTHGHQPEFKLASEGSSLHARTETASAFTVVDRGLGRVALRKGEEFISVAPDGRVSMKSSAPGITETFQWIETFTGELTLMSLTTHRYLRIDFDSGVLVADSPGPEPNGPDGVRFDWH
jgi:hypothetical protein